MEQFFDTKSVIDVRGDTHGKKENRLYPGAVYHVMSRGNGKKNIFECRED